MEIPVWQFVRIMVACERRPNSRLLAANADSWAELDEALTGLAQSDFDCLLEPDDAHRRAYRSPE